MQLIAPLPDQERRTSGDLSPLLDWLRRLLAWQIAVTRQNYGPLADDEYRGLYIPTVEVELLCAEAPELPPDLAAERDTLARERMALAQQRQAPQFQRLAETFGLDQFAQDVVLLALAPELDLRFERIFAYIQDDVSRRRPAIDLALRLFCPTPAERLAHQRAFMADAPLIQQQLVTLIEDGQRRPPLIARFLKLDDRIVAALRDGDLAGLDAQITPFSTLAWPERTLDQLMLPAALLSQLRRTIGAGVVLALQGGYGSGRNAIAHAACAELELPVLSVDLDRLITSEAAAPVGSATDPTTVLRRVTREAVLRGAAVIWHQVDRVLHDETQATWRHALLGTLGAFPGISFLLIERAWEAQGALNERRFMRVELQPLSYSEREILWRQRLNGDGPDDVTLHTLASTFRLSAGQIRDAAHMARSLARWRDQATTPVVTKQDLYAACHAQSSSRLDLLAHKIRPTYSWEDIVLPTDQMNMLREIYLQVRHRQTVLERWGFEKRLAMGKGVNVLFAGQSGTGKTMAAEIIAADLGLELYKIDLSTMVSKYIGETEKNLDGVFRAAREANAILFFDEADALFGKRSEVKDAHDRYANIEVGYLLQKMEEYDGVVILATNLRKNLDEAFVRRLHVAIDFPFPEEHDRLNIWQRVFPAEAPLADVDLPLLARQFRLTGGNIRNVALLAAYLAAEDGGAITLDHCMRAIRREYQKLGKLVTAAEFGQHLAAARG